MRFLVFKKLVIWKRVRAVAMDKAFALAESAYQHQKAGRCVSSSPHFTPLLITSGKQV